MDWFISNIGMFVRIAQVLACICIFFVIYYFWTSGLVAQLGADGKTKVKELIMRSLSGSSKTYNYNSIDLKLKQLGVKFYYPWMNPVTYICIKAGLTIIGAILGFIAFSWIVAILIGFICWNIPDFIFKLSDKSDNDAIVEDIISIYDTLRLQTKAGIYLSTSLVECYTVVRNRRLKKAMLELTSEILAKNDIVNSIEDFSTKFDNSYIDSFGVIIRQGIESGQIVKILDDIGNQLKDLKHLINEKEKKKVESQILFCELLIYIGIILLTIFIVMGSMDMGAIM